MAEDDCVQCFSVSLLIGLFLGPLSTGQVPNVRHQVTYHPVGRRRASRDMFKSLSRELAGCGDGEEEMQPAIEFGRVLEGCGLRSF